MSIVIVDDSVTHLVVLKHLARSNYSGDIQTFSDPELARQHLAENKAEVVIVDCEMPGTDGITFTRRLRIIPIHSATPVIMVTNHTDDKTRIDALQAGVTEFLSKPVKSDEFKLRVRNILYLQSLTQ